MSGYGGYPSGWQDPRGPQGWSGSPYPGGPQPPGYGYGPPPGPVRPTSNASTTAKKDDTKKKAPEVLAPVQVNKSRLIEVNREIVELQDQIDREKKKTKSTETDKALNDSRVSSALSIFGGSSAESRAELAKERVSLMESELEFLTMAMAAKTPAERDDLEKQAGEMREMRRNLERSGTGPK